MTKSRNLSKSSGQTHSTRGSRQSGSSQAIPPATTMNNPDAAEHQSFSGLPHRHSILDPQTPSLFVAKDEMYQDTGFQGQLYATDSDSSFSTGAVRTTSGASWDNTMSMGDLGLEHCQPFITNERYQVADSTVSLRGASQSMFVPLAIEPSIDFSTAPYLGPNTVTVGIAENSFENDFPSGSISYDSNPSLYMSPPLSPELQGQTWSGLPCDYDANGDYPAQGPASLVYPQVGGFSQHPSSPPSPPMSDSSPHTVLTSAREHSARTQLTTMENCIMETGFRGVKSTKGEYVVSGSALAATSTRSAGSTGQNPTHSTRPAQRLLKPASEKPRGHDLVAQPAASSVHAKPKEKPETTQPRNHHLYKALPGKDGLFRCPFAKETQCAHPPTKQKCGYDKYLDSHLKPYHCKHADCRELKFSSNACLFRHEREAHGMHFYGKNPHRCHYAGCDRAIEGFPRRWNLHDHMRRVHKHDASQPMDAKDDCSDYEVPSKRKGSGAPTSCQMKRTSSSQAKARAASASYSRDSFEAVDLGYQARYTEAPRINYVETFEPVKQQTMNLANGLSYPLQHISHGDAAPPISYGFSYPS